MRAVFRKSKQSDAKVLAEILMRVFNAQGQHWTTKSALKRIKEQIASDRLTLTVLQGKKPIGLFSGRPYIYDNGLNLLVEEVFLDPAVHQKGVGSKAMQQFVKEARRKNIKCLILATNSKQSAFKFYQKMGFKPSEYILFEKNL